MLTAAHIDNPSSRLGSLDEGEEEVGEEEGGEVVDPQLVLHTILRPPVRRVLDSGTVDQNVHAWLSLQHLGSELSHRVETGQLALLHLDLSLTKNNMKIAL